MTFKDLKKRVSNEKNNGKSGSFNYILADIKGAPFWIPDNNEHSILFDKSVEEQLNDYPSLTKETVRPMCCFKHFIGLAQKHGKYHPLYDYEQKLIDLWEDPNVKGIFLLKARGIGATTTKLEHTLYCFVNKPNYKSATVPIMTGPREDLAIDIIKKAKRILARKLYTNFNWQSKEQILDLNEIGIDGQIKAFPSQNIGSLRGDDIFPEVILDEADFFRKKEQTEIRPIVDGYIVKTHAKVSFITTPNQPGGLAELMIQEEPSLYTKIFYDYTVALGKLYTVEDIETAKLSSSFEQEFCLKFGGTKGNVFMQQAIDWSITDEIIDPNPYALKSIGIDPGFGSSAFGICVTQFNNGRIEILYADEFNRSSYEDMVNLFWELKERYQQITNVYVDASFPVIIKTLKKEVGEADDWEYVKKTMEYCKKNHMDIEDAMVVVPVAFGNNGGVELLQNAKMLLEDSSQLVRIPRSYEKMITALRTAWAEDFRLDKEQTSYDDLLDAFRLALWKYKLRK